MSSRARWYRLWRRSRLCHLLFFLVTVWQLSAIIDPARRKVEHGESSTENNIVENWAMTTLSFVWYNISIHTEPIHDWWRLMRSTMGPVFLYSAYYEQRTSPHKVRVIAAAPFGIRSHRIECEAKTKDGDKRRLQTTKKLIRENWGLPYSAYFIMCNVGKDFFPESVALVDPVRNVLSPYLKVHYPPPTPAANVTSPTLAVCVKPLHFHYNRAVWLVEFIEMYNLLGTDHFFFYNKSVGPDVDRVLRHYSKRGLVTVLPWNLPLKTKKHIRTEGIFAALNDCSYRQINRYTYVAMVDLDEYIIPRKHKGFKELLKQLASTTRNKGSFVFRNAFFYLYWENDTSVLQSGDSTPYLQTLAKTRRLKMIHRSGVRSKYIVRPPDAIELGNHVVWEHVSGKSSHIVSDTLALSHHYRICEFGGYACMKQPSVVDKATHKYATELLRRVTDTCQKVFPAMGHCPEAPPLGSPW